MPTRITHSRFSLRDKIRIIDDYKSGMSYRKVAIKWKCHKSCVQALVAEEAKWRAFLDEGGAAATTSMKKLKFESVDKFMWQWHNNVRARLIPTSMASYQVRATKYAIDAKIDGFAASTGWLAKFFKRHGITRKIIAGESSSVDQQVVAVWNQERLPTLLAQYDLNDIIYNIYTIRDALRTSAKALCQLFGIQTSRHG